MHTQVLTIKTLTLLATTLRQYKQREKSNTNLLQSFKNPIAIKDKKIRMKVHSGKGDKATEKAKLQVKNR